MSWPPALRDDRSAPFFDGAARGELLIRRCAHCAHALAPGTSTCTFCGSADLDWTAAEPGATLVSWTVVHRAPNAAYTEQVPYVIGLVELSEGPWMYARIIDCGPDALRDRMPLTVEFERPEGSEPYPVFAPAA